jgi:adenylate cyclase
LILGIEIERKFLVSPEDFETIKFSGVRTIKQGYLANSKEKSVRIRIDDNRGYLTVKGGASGISKLEFEYDIPVEEAEEMLKKLTDGKLVEKKRYIYLQDAKVWEVDVFQGNNSGLIVAEIELKSEDEEITIPDWCGEEVSTDTKYINARLIDKPYKEW